MTIDIYIINIYIYHIYRVGFTNVSATDLTNEFIDILKLELEKFKPKRAEFVKVC